MLCQITSANGLAPIPGSKVMSESGGKTGASPPTIPDVAAKTDSPNRSQNIQRFFKAPTPRAILKPSASEVDRHCELFISFVAK